MVVDSIYDDIADWYDNYLGENPIYQDIVLPSVLEMVGEIDGQAICDVACGQGWIARVLARRGGHVTGVDLSERQIMLARRYEERDPLGITFSAPTSRASVPHAVWATPMC